MIHPSLIQKIDLDERQATKAVIEELKRSYNYVGPISVAKHAATEPPCNVFQMIIRLSKPYWRSSDPDGDAMWGEVSTWLKNKLYKVGSTMVNYNKSHEGDDRPLVSYGRLELEMKEVMLGFGLPTVDELPPVDEQVARYRELLNAGAFEGLQVTSVDIPSKESYAAQWAAAVEEAERKAAEEAARKAAEEAAAAEAAAQAAEAEAVEKPEDAAEDEGCAAGTENAQANGVAAGEETPAGEVEVAQADAEVEDEACAEGAAAQETPAEPEPLVVEMPAVDYRVWGVVLADGSVRAFDSVAGAWL